ncbi:ATP-binding cassette transporter [Clonorchis sinensis]|uniref:ATP-binding cassette transporter n=1 Tax=Clonorchis sinensis TaxID=79923 RepID=G7YHD5_CLOSI|nr:ATP-binding cassette transporter [Clonorchis sinensis]
MEKAQKAGNARRLFQLIRATGIGKPPVSETIKDRNGVTISNKEERLDRWAEYFEQQLSWQPAGTHRNAPEVREHNQLFVFQDFRTPCDENLVDLEYADDIVSIFEEQEKAQVSLDELTKVIPSFGFLNFIKAYCLSATTSSDYNSSFNYCVLDFKSFHIKQNASISPHSARHPVCNRLAYNRTSSLPLKAYHEAYYSSKFSCLEAISLTAINMMKSSPEMARKSKIPLRCINVPMTAVIDKRDLSPTTQLPRHQSTSTRFPMILPSYHLDYKQWSYLPNCLFLSSHFLLVRSGFRLLALPEVRVLSATTQFYDQLEGVNFNLYHYNNALISTGCHRKRPMSLTDYNSPNYGKGLGSIEKVVHFGAFYVCRHVEFGDQTLPYDAGYHGQYDIRICSVSGYCASLSHAQSILAPPESLQFFVSLRVLNTTYA